jgi:hypothetical protein
VARAAAPTTEPRVALRSALPRRSLLASLACLLAGCRPPASPERELLPPALPDVEVARLSDLLTGAHLEWLVLMRPEELARIEWLKPSLGRVFKDDRLDLLAKATGIQLREVPELALASYRQPDGTDAVAFLLRHRSDPLSLERKFRERLTSGAERSEVGHQLVGMWGLIGRAGARRRIGRPPPAGRSTRSRARCATRR